MKNFRRSNNARGATLVEAVVALNFAVFCILMLSTTLTSKLNKVVRTAAWAINDPCDYLEGLSEAYCTAHVGGGSEEGAN